MPRGGKRPGAGARKGNLNGLNMAATPVSSPISAQPSAKPAARASLLRMTARDEARGRKADELAALILSQIIAPASSAAARD